MQKRFKKVQYEDSSVLVNKDVDSSDVVPYPLLHIVFVQVKWGHFGIVEKAFCQIAVRAMWIIVLAPKSRVAFPPCFTDLEETIIPLEGVDRHFPMG